MLGAQKNQVLSRIVSEIKDENNFVAFCFCLVKILPTSDRFTKRCLVLKRIRCSEELSLRLKMKIFCSLLLLFGKKIQTSDQFNIIMFENMYT